jgi:AcrR family transcriptional regulator
MNAPVKPRRKPSQSRAWMTSGAIQDALVKLLVEQPYEKVSMREIASVAGVGLGTLYLYFPGKESIAAVTVRSWLRKHAAFLAETASAAPARTLAETVQLLVGAHVRGLLGHAAEWRAVLYLERHISSPESYREVYLEYVAVWREALVRASDWEAERDAARTAFNAFAIVEAMVHRALLVQDPAPPIEDLVRDVEAAVMGYLYPARS